MPLDTLDIKNRTLAQTGNVPREELFNILPPLTQTISAAAKAELTAAITATLNLLIGPYRTEPDGRYNPTIGNYGIPGLKESMAADLVFQPAPEPHPTLINGSAPMAYIDMDNVSVDYLEKVQLVINALVTKINAAP